MVNDWDLDKSNIVTDSAGHQVKADNTTKSILSSYREKKQSPGPLPVLVIGAKK